MEHDNIVYVVEMITKNKQYFPVLVGETLHSAVTAADEFVKEQSNDDVWDFDCPYRIEAVPFYKFSLKMDFWTRIAYILIVFSPWRLVRKLGCWIMIRHTGNLLERAGKGL